MSDSNVNPFIQSKEISEFWLTGEWNEPKKNPENDNESLTAMAANTSTDISKKKNTAYDGYEKGVQRAYYTYLGERMMRKPSIFEYLLK